MKEYLPKSQRDSILHNLINKYQADPERFRSYLPELAQELEQLLPSHTRKSHTSVLTELERERLCNALLQLLDGRSVSSGEAIQALEYCATLVQDESLPQKVDRKTLLSLLHQSAGISFSKVKKTTKIPVGEGEAIKEVALLRGVYLQLTWNDRLVAISIFPAKSKERSRALKFVGVAKDSASDVSQRHDVYLAEGLNAIS